MKEKKKVLLVLGILITILSVIGVSYALWELNLVQKGQNIISTGCFNVEFTDLDPIHLLKAYPILDEEGMKLNPYQFTITNTCNNEANYQINLEILNNSTLTELQYIKEVLTNEENVLSSKVLTENTEVDKTLDNASTAYKLNTGTLKEGESKTFFFRLWMDESTPNNKEIMNKVLNTKITVITSLKVPVDTTNMIKERYLNEEDNYSFMENSETIEFQNTISPIDGIEPVDISYSQNQSVLAYFDGVSATIIQANGRIVFPENSASLFANYFYLKEIRGMENIDTSKVTDMNYMFYYARFLTSLDLSNFDTSKVTYMSHMFHSMSDLTSLDVSSFDTSKVTNMQMMFNGMSSLTSLDVSSFDTYNVTNMYGIFGSMYSLTSLDLSSFDTSSVMDMMTMFNGMNSLTRLDLSNFNTSNVTNMYGMFCNMHSLTSLDVSSFDTSKVTSMQSMFAGVSSLTDLNLSNFNTSNASDMDGMFYGMTSLTSLDLSNFDTSNVTYMSEMFRNTPHLATVNYGSRFVYTNKAIVLSMYTNSTAPKPTHASWNGVTF